MTQNLAHSARFEIIPSLFLSAASQASEDMKLSQADVDGLAAQAVKVLAPLRREDAERVVEEATEYVKRMLLASLTADPRDALIVASMFAINHHAEDVLAPTSLRIGANLINSVIGQGRGVSRWTRVKKAAAAARTALTRPLNTEKTFTLQLH